MISPEAPAAGTAAGLALFIDFDGTLVALAARPEDVDMPAELPAILAALRRRLGGALAIVSGRPMAAIDGFLAPEKFAIAGAHGAERRRADGTMLGVAPELMAAARRIGDRLTPLAEAEPRLALEIKAGAVALHFRAAPDLEDRCRQAMTEALADEPDFTMIAGKMVFEGRPRTVDKGTATTAFMAEAPFAGRIPIFIGDDRTDEDGFASVQDAGGLGIKVGEGPTTAAVRLEDVAAVYRLLSALGDGGVLTGLAAIRAFADKTEGAQP